MFKLHKYPFACNTKEAHCWLRNKRIYCKDRRGVVYTSNVLYIKT